MTDHEETAQPARSMSERIRDTRIERQRVDFERLFGPRGDTATDDEPPPDDDGDAAA